MKKHVWIVVLLVILFSCRASGQIEVQEVLSLAEGAQDGWSVFLGDEKFLIHRKNGDVERWSVDPLQREAVVLNKLGYAKQHLPEQPGETQMPAEERLRWRSKAIQIAHHPDSEYFLLYHYEGEEFMDTAFYQFGPDFWNSSEAIEPEYQWRLKGQVAFPALLPDANLMLFAYISKGNRTPIELRHLDSPLEVSGSFKLGGHYKGHWWSEKQGLVLASLINQFASDYVISQQAPERNRIRKIGHWQLPEGLQILEFKEKLGDAIVWNTKPSPNHIFYFGSPDRGLRKLAEGNMSISVSVRTTARHLSAFSPEPTAPDVTRQFQLVEVSSGEKVASWLGYPREHPKVLSKTGRYLLSWCNMPEADKNGWILRDFGN